MGENLLHKANDNIGLTSDVLRPATPSIGPRLVHRTGVKNTLSEFP
jgi:hypothetical protein